MKRGIENLSGLTRVLLVISILLISLPVTADEEVTVIVTGKAPVRDNNQAMARSMAILVAKGMAVEEGSGMVLTLLDRPDIRRVELKSRGRVSRYTIDQEGVDAGIYSVTMTAKVIFPGVSRDLSPSGSPQITSDVKPAYEALQLTVESGRIDWQSGTIYATGRAPAGSSDPTAVVKARRVALADAYANALKIAETINVDRDRDVKQLSEKSDVAQALEAKVRGGKISSEGRADNGDVTVEIAIPLWGVQGIHTVFVPYVRKPQTAEKGSSASSESPVLHDSGNDAPSQPPATEQKADETASREQPPADSEPPAPGEEESYTGVVIDASATDAEPALFPAIETESGSNVWDAGTTDESAMEQQGMASYVVPADSGSTFDGSMRYFLRPGTASPLLAYHSSRISSDSMLSFSVFFGQTPGSEQSSSPYPRRTGRKPLVVKGLKTEGSNKSTILISNADAEKLKNSKELQEHLKDCRVVVVVRSEAGGTEGRIFKAPPEWFAALLN